MPINIQTANLAKAPEAAFLPRVAPDITGWLVVFRIGKGPAYDHFCRLGDAVRDFDRAPEGWTALAIVPARGGIPVGGPLTEAEITAARRVA